MSRWVSIDALQMFGRNSIDGREALDRRSTAAKHEGTKIKSGKSHEETIEGNTKKQGT